MASDAQSNKLYLYFWHPYSPVMYSLYEIDVPNPLPPLPTKDAQDEQIVNPNHLEPILQLKTGEYPGNMCCVSLGSKLYFMGGEYDIDYPCIDEDVKVKYKNVKRDIFPRDVYIFDPTTPSLLLHGTAMNSGKSWPLAFVADEKIYVLGSNFTTDIFDTSRRKDSELKSLSLFEVYHPKDDKWTILPNPPIGNVETSWVGHAVERRKVFFIASQPGKDRLYCFDLDRGQWTKHITLPSDLCNVSGRIEVIDGTFYGCYHNTIAAIAPVAKEEEGEEEEEEEGEEREQKMEEEDELNIQQQEEEDEMGARFRNYRLHVVSGEMGMNAIFNVPQQLHSSSSLLYLGNRCFCYVMTGMPPHPKYGSDHDAIEDDKVRVISIVLFQALGETYKEDAIIPFKAKFLHSAHYAVKTPFPNEGIIHGCFSLGWPQGQNNGLDNLIPKIEKQEMELVMSKGLGFNPSKTLNEIKIKSQRMSQNHLFSCGLELANLVVSSGVLYHSWAAVRDLYSEINQNEQPSLSVRYKVSQQPNCTTIAFFTWPACSKDYIIQGGVGEDLVSSSTLKESFPLFEFLCTKTNPQFSINKAAIDLFASIRDSLPSLKSQIDSKPVIITGNSLGGSVASLFTLWLLEKINLSSTKTCPLCITFGSPLVGDDGLQEAISKYPTWNSCFLHVVSDHDPVPRVLISPVNPIDSIYKPFGTFLLHSELGCACFEDSQSILDLLTATYSEGPENQNPNQVLEFYEALVQHLNHKQQQRNNGIDNLITRTERQEKKLVILKRHVFDPSKEFNDMKINMAYLERYKKHSKDKGGYYDSYKNPGNLSDLNVVRHKKILTCYWEKMVDEADKKPQKEGASFRTRWLFAGTNYRWMCEPLDIAEYYNNGLKDYINKGRPKRYKQLEQWLKEIEPVSNPSQLKKQNVASSLTEDSCFWAHVEEARISCELLSSRESSIGEKESSKHNLVEFENYVLSLMKNYAVSPEIFLPRSSFMLWWKEYEEIVRKGIVGAAYYSPLTDLMKSRSYQNYATGDLEIP